MRKKILLYCIVLIWLGVIFCFSAMDGNASGALSKKVTITVVTTYIKIGQKIGVVSQDITKAEAKKLVTLFHHYVRKLAHATEYGLLAFLILLSLGTNKITLKRNILIVIVACFFYSLTDEYHQTFVSGRGGVFTDCLIDTLGAMIASLLYRIQWKEATRKERGKIAEFHPKGTG